MRNATTKLLYVILGITAISTSIVNAQSFYPEASVGKIGWRSLSVNDQTRALKQPVYSFAGWMPGTQTITSANEFTTFKKFDTDAELPSFAWNINPLGLFQFGPIFQAEFKIHNTGYIVPYFRYAFAGVLTHLTWTEFSEGDFVSPLSMAVGAGYKGFINSTGNSLYFGGFVDLGFTKVHWDIDESYETEEKEISLGFIANVGYRWRHQRSSNFNLGGFLGYGLILKNEEVGVSNGYYDSNTSNDFPLVAMLELSFGWEVRK